MLCCIVFTVEISKTVDMYMFLFDDILLLTKVKKPPRKVGQLDPMSFVLYISLHNLLILQHIGILTYILMLMTRSCCCTVSQMM